MPRRDSASYPLRSPPGPNGVARQRDVRNTSRQRSHRCTSDGHVRYDFVDRGWRVLGQSRRQQCEAHGRCSARTPPGRATLHDLGQHGHMQLQLGALHLSLGEYEVRARRAATSLASSMPSSRCTHDSPIMLSSEAQMPRGDKGSYTDKQKRQAEHIEEGYEKRGQPKGEAERRAWATVNKMTHGGKKSGSGRGRSEDHSSARKGGRIGGHSMSTAARSRAAKKGWATRRKAAH